jgi:exopolysaccharide biosynthesis polyprenyl glycosylphosphotransferase
VDSGYLARDSESPLFRERAVAFRLTAMVSDTVAIAGTFLGAAWLRTVFREVYTLDLIPGDTILLTTSVAQHLALVPVIVPLWILSLHYHECYDDLRRLRPDVLLIRITRATVVALLVLLGGLYAVQAVGVSRTLLAIFAFSTILSVYGSRMALRGILRRFFNDADTWNILVVGASSEVSQLVRTVRDHRHWGIRILGVVGPDGDKTPPPYATVPQLGGLSDLPMLLEHEPVHQVLMTGRAWDTETLRRVADSCEELGIRFSMDANFLGLSVARAQLEDFDGWSVLSFSSTPANVEALVVKRMIDIVVSVIALALLSPLLLLVLVLIRLEDGGPALFHQERSGLYGRTFRMWKFRSMVVDAERQRASLESRNEMSGPVFKIAKDPRVTRLGSFIRRTSIDELPQFWNVLRGEMSLVGPRPPIVSEVRHYERWQKRRLSMKPGLTCIWQVSGRNDVVDFETWMRQDLQYIDNWSLFLDLKLMFQTLPVVLLGIGAR